MIIMHLKDEPFEAIKSGVKRYEIRVNDEKRQKMGIGDAILFKRLSDSLDGVVVRISDRREFNTFDDMIKCLDFKDIGMEGKTVQEVLDLYHSFYSSEEEKKYGVVAFKIDLM